jgi:hypothetical protein
MRTQPTSDPADRMISKAASCLIFGLVVFMAGASRAHADPSSCRETGVDAGLTQTNSQRLCRNAKNNGPVECFSKAREKAGLAISDSIQLCQCAQSSAPADCVSMSLHKLHVGRQDALLSCEGQKQRALGTQQCMALDGSAG